MPSNIFEAIHEIYKEVGYVQKSGKVSVGAGYRYAGEADLIAALRPAMNQNKVVVSVNEIERDVARTIVKKQNGESVVTSVSVRAKVRFTHAPSGTHIDVMAIGEGNDNGDKASYKAMTGAFKYALRQTFCIETGDDPDQTAEPAPVPEKRQPAPAAPSKADLEAAADKVLADVRAAQTLDELRNAWKDNAVMLSTLKAHAPDVMELVNAAKDARKSEIERKG